MECLKNLTAPKSKTVGVAKATAAEVQKYVDKARAEAQAGLRHLANTLPPLALEADKGDGAARVACWDKVLYLDPTSIYARFEVACARVKDALALRDLAQAVRCHARQHTRRLAREARELLDGAMRDLKSSPVAEAPSLFVLNERHLNCPVPTGHSDMLRVLKGQIELNLGLACDVLGDGAADAAIAEAAEVQRAESLGTYMLGGAVLKTKDTTTKVVAESGREEADNPGGGVAAALILKARAAEAAQARAEAREAAISAVAHHRNAAGLIKDWRTFTLWREVRRPNCVIITFFTR
jgi:hypothetical protein